MDPIGQDVLTKFKSINPVFKDAMIAGGFVRDHILGGRFSDIDIYYPTETSTTEDAIDEILGNKYYDADLVFHSVAGEDHHYKKIEGLIVVINFKFKGSIPVQVMAYKVEDKDTFKEKVLESFDFNICKLYFDGDKTYVSKEAEEDIKYSRATLVKAKDFDNYTKSLSRFERWRVKYPSLALRNLVRFYSEEEVQEYREEIRRLQAQLAGANPELYTTSISPSPIIGKYHTLNKKYTNQWITTNSTAG